jgi:hypothetical protein
MRLEYKYLVSNDLLDNIRADIRPFVNLDNYALRQHQQEYTVRSVYFDNPIMSAYSEKIDGIGLRKKFRLRGYNELHDDDIIFLEIKRKYENFIKKNRAPLRYRDIPDLFATCDVDKYVLSMNGSNRGKDDARQFFFHCRRRKLNPSILVVYDREAYCSKFDPTLRVTLDKNIRSAPCIFSTDLHVEYPLKYAFRRNFIFELKFNGGLPAWVTAVINRYQMPRLALSKYTICLDSHKQWSGRLAIAPYITLRRCFAKT